MEKVLSRDEQSLVAGSDFPEHMIWILWSVKESAFKVCNRKTGLSSFSPVSYEVHLEERSLFRYMQQGQYRLQENGFKNFNMLYARVTSPSGTLLTATLVHADYVHSFAYTSAVSPEEVRWGITCIADTMPSYQSYIARLNAIEHIAVALRIERGEIDIPSGFGNSRIPLVHLNGLQAKEVQLTLAHHGHWVAHAFLRPY